MRFRTISVDGLSERHIQRAMRLNCLGSLFYFIRVALRRKRLTEALHLPLCRTFEREHIKDVIEMPRDMFKSTCASEGLPMWRALPFSEQDESDFRALGYDDAFIRWMSKMHRPESRNLLVSGNITNAAKLGKRIRFHFESNALYRTLFPETIPDTSCTWTDYSLHVKPINGAGTHGEGTFDFLGVGSAVQSRHYDGIVVEDDLIGIKESESQALMDKAIEYHKLLVGIFEIEDPEHQLDELVIGNRWGYSDLNSHLREHEPEFRFESHSAEGGCCDRHPDGISIFPEEFSLSKLQTIRRRLGNYRYSCFAAGTKVLMADLHEKNIEQLEVGDEIVGFEPAGCSEHHCCLKKATVQFVNARQAEVVWIIMRSGRSFMCTPDHKFLVPLHRERGFYQPLSKLSQLVTVYTPRVIGTHEQRMMDWLGGIFDGEGSASGATPCISQSPTKNPEVSKAIQDTLAALGLEYSFIEDSESYNVQGGRSTVIFLANNCCMAKRQRFVDMFWRKPGKIGAMHDPFDVIDDIRVMGQMTVYNIQSSSGNYIANGYATANCQFLNNPAAPEDCEFKEDWLNYFALKWNEAKTKFKVMRETKDGEVEPDLYSVSLNLAMVVDPNHSGNAMQGRCRHAIVVVGIDAKGNTYLLDSWAEGVSYDDLYDKIFEIAQKWHLHKIGVETIGAQTYIKHHVEFLCAVKGYSLRVEDLKGQVELEDGTTARNKKFRILGVIQPLAESGRLWVQRTQISFLNEYRTFSMHRNSRYVDQLDAFAYAPQIATRPMDDEDYVDLVTANQEGMERLGKAYSYGYGKSFTGGVFHA